MKLYSYVVTHDTGFAPNPFWGFCTLACCKPVIRRTAEVGDWIVGISPKRHGNRLIYAMRVDETIPFTSHSMPPPIWLWQGGEPPERHSLDAQQERAVHYQ